MKYLVIILAITVEVFACAALLFVTGILPAEDPFVQSCRAAVLVPLFFLAFHVVVLLHELGHFVAGKRVGFEFAALVVGAFCLSRSKGKYTFSLISQPVSGGLASMTPIGDQDLVRRYSRFIIGGPVASVIGALVFVGTLYAFKISPIPVVADDSVTNLLRFCGLVSGVVLLEFCIPYTLRSGLPTDLRQLIDLRKRPELANLLKATIAFAKQRVEGRPNTWSKATIADLITNSAKDSEKVFAHLAGYLHELDSGNVSEAGTHLFQARNSASTLPKANLIRNGVYYESATFAAWITKDQSFARTCLAETKSGIDTLEPSRLTALAALAIATNQTEEALRLLSSFDDRMKKVIKQSGIPYEFDCERAEAMREVCIAARRTEPSYA